MGTNGSPFDCGVNRSRCGDVGPLMDERQLARVSLEIGKAVRMHAEASLTPKGILGIGVLVSGILLSTSVLVATAIREDRKARAADGRPVLPEG